MTRRLSDNHAGWQVEFLTDDGWEPAYLNNDGTPAAPLAVKAEAEAKMAILAPMLPSYEFRVYEAVKCKS